jgi:hypothetical protein
MVWVLAGWMAPDGQRPGWIAIAKVLAPYVLAFMLLRFLAGRAGRGCSAGAASRTGAGHGRRWGHSGPGSVNELLLHDRGISAPAGPSDS